MMNNLYLCHHGVIGQKWGVRRYQNTDGSLTDAGKKRYIRNMKKAANPIRERLGLGSRYLKENNKMIEDYLYKHANLDDYRNTGGNNNFIAGITYTKRLMADATGVPIDDLRANTYAMSVVAKALRSQEANRKV